MLINNVNNIYGCAVCRGKEALGRDAIAERIPVSFYLLAIFYVAKWKVVLMPKLCVWYLSSSVREWSF